ncbi:ABC transporter ATP-binding protein/permease [Actinotignum schaalii]|uniref:ABC transporter ATP-binding protein/permease n=1 Tax=Actinotignum schaalii TaxID=59505 RepID=UPI0003F9D027|nr:ATP-binding cassette domain-containing protein [Actinotignum schaalii]AIE82272.1 ABC transporter ATP-binding protein [Actinotignum schaalii]WQN44307.1 ATP-binding cassette domain-containing protein [Actinotignum schaalii]
MFTQQRRVMTAGGLTIWLLIPPILIGLVVSGLYVTTAALNAALFTELLGQRRYSTIVPLVAVIAVLLIVRPLMDVCGQLVQNRAGLVVKTNLRRSLLQEIDRQGPMRVGLGRSGNIQSVITDGVEAIEPYFIKYFTQLAVTVVTALALTTALAQISIWIALVLLVCGIAVVAIPRLWDKALAERGQSHWIAYETLNADFIDAMMGMPTLKSFGAADSYGDKLNRQSRQLLTSTLGQLRLSLGETGLSGMMKVLGPALALIIAIVQVRAGNMELGQLFLVTLLSVEMFRPFNQLSSCWHESFFGISALPSMNEIFTRIPFDSTEQVRASSNQSANPDLGISFEEVTYAYLGTDEPAIEKMSFHIEAGKTTSIVGLSGSGKSTALGLLIGYDQPMSGRISVFGLSPANADVTQLVTLVPQEPIIFPGTVREILRNANPAATDAQMMQALAIARADTLHMEFDDDAEAKQRVKQEVAAESVLDVQVFEHAKNLSGGQKQRLAIARALIRGTEILVLDESTSALDTYTEHQLITELRSAYPELTLVLVTHRIDTAAKSDQVIVLADHHVSCAGAPKELEQDPQSTWAKLVAAQRGEN